MAAENKEIEEFDDEDFDLPSVFWTLKIPVNKEVDIPPPAIPGFIIHITSATFGENVKSQSRTVVNCIQTTDDGKDITSPVCILREGACETLSLNLLFSEAVSFKLAGRKPSEVTLNGYLQAPPTPEGMGMDEAALEDYEEQQIEDELRKRKRKLQEMDDENTQESSTKGNNNDEDEEDADEDNNEDEGNDENEQESEQEEEQPKVEHVSKKRKLNNDDNKSNKKNTKGKKDMKTLKNGIKVRDMKVGNGKQIKNGMKVTCKYVGQLEDKSVFDKEISGAGFSFNFGKGEVIKGWDLGLKGMKVGGKRRLVIPPKLAYGRDGSEPSIPPNATLTFTIEIIKAE